MTESEPADLTIRESRLANLSNLTKSQRAAQAVMNPLPKLMEEARKRHFKNGGPKLGQSNDLAGKAVGVGASVKLEKQAAVLVPRSVRNRQDAHPVLSHFGDRQENGE